MAKNANSAKKQESRILEDQTQAQTTQAQTEVNAIPLDDKGRKKEVRMSMEELEKKGCKNKSQAIRYLIGEGHSPSAVAKFLDIRYQHVRNVMMQPLKKQAETATVTETK